MILLNTFDRNCESYNKDIFASDFGGIKAEEIVKVIIDSGTYQHKSKQGDEGIRLLISAVFRELEQNGMEERAIDEVGGC